MLKFSFISLNYLLLSRVACCFWEGGWDGSMQGLRERRNPGKPGHMYCLDTAIFWNKFTNLPQKIGFGISCKLSLKENVNAIFKKTWQVKTSSFFFFFFFFFFFALINLPMGKKMLLFQKHTPVCLFIYLFIYWNMLRMKASKDLHHHENTPI